MRVRATLIECKNSINDYQKLPIIASFCLSLIIIVTFSITMVLCLFRSDSDMQQMGDNSAQNDAVSCRMRSLKQNSEYGVLMNTEFAGHRECRRC